MYLSFDPDALREWLYGLPQWQRERVAEAITALLYDPRPRAAEPVPYGPGDSHELYAGDCRVVYRVYQDDTGDDLLVGIIRVNAVGPSS